MFEENFWIAMFFLVGVLCFGVLGHGAQNFWNLYFYKFIVWIVLHFYRR